MLIETVHERQVSPSRYAPRDHIHAKLVEGRFPPDASHSRMCRGEQYHRVYRIL